MAYRTLPRCKGRKVVMVVVGMLAVMVMVMVIMMVEGEGIQG
jgi:hypothetical protein